MTNFPSVDELEVALYGGQGGAIIVEGNSYQDDPWFYGQWFSDRAQDATFYPQNGWLQVIAAVKELRQKRIGVPIYGIIDRDFCDGHQLDSDFESSGILRTPLYTLENYLLDPKCWASLFARIFKRNPSGARGLDDEARVGQVIAKAYEDCLALAAHNWTVKTISAKYSSPTFISRDYLTHYKAVKDLDAISQSLADWETRIGVNENLPRLFQDRFNQLRGASPEMWAQQVSGKYVLERFYDLSPLPNNFRTSHLWVFYMESCTTPPRDLVNLLDRIIKHAGV